MTVTDITELVGMALIVAGVWLWFGLPVALVVAGGVGFGWGIAHAGSGRGCLLGGRE